MIKRLRTEIGEDIIENNKRYVHTYTVPNFEYESKEYALKRLKALDIDFISKDVLVEGCEHYGPYTEIYIKEVEVWELL
tara:strand:- start:110 stop:346 length:237 start_codon:yes stop_codon:yes gene_type:complete